MSSVEEVVEEEDEDFGEGVFPDGVPADDVISVTSAASTSSSVLRMQVERVREVARLKAQEVGLNQCEFTCLN